MAKSVRLKNPVTKGLDRHAIVVTRTSPRTWELRERQYGEVFATIHMVQGRKGKCYTYKLVKEQRVHKGFESLKACVGRVLTKV